MLEILLHVARGCDVDHQERRRPAGARRRCPASTCARLRLVVDGVEGGDQVVALRLVERGHVARLEAGVRRGRAPRRLGAACGDRPPRRSRSRRSGSPGRRRHQVDRVARCRSRRRATSIPASRRSGSPGTSGSVDVDERRVEDLGRLLGHQLAGSAGTRSRARRRRAGSTRRPPPRPRRAARCTARRWPCCRARPPASATAACSGGSRYVPRSPGRTRRCRRSPSRRATRARSARSGPPPRRSRRSSPAAAPAIASKSPVRCPRLSHQREEAAVQDLEHPAGERLLPRGVHLRCRHHPAPPRLEGGTIRRRAPFVTRTDAVADAHGGR